MLHKLSQEHALPTKADRGQITTILEQDECRADSIDSTHTDASCSDRAQPVPHSGEEATSAGSDPLTGSRRLPKVRVHRATADAAAQVAIAGDRQNSLPDLSSRRVPRHRSMSRKDSGSMSHREIDGPARVASQVRKCCCCCCCCTHHSSYTETYKMSTKHMLHTLDNISGNDSLMARLKLQVFNSSAKAYHQVIITKALMTGGANST